MESKDKMAKLKYYTVIKKQKWDLNVELSRLV